MSTIQWGTYGVKLNFLLQFSQNGAVNPIATAATGGELYQASAIQI
ncbi:MAG: hypothetical protein ACYT04_35190 [Nostoc sp.]